MGGGISAPSAGGGVIGFATAEEETLCCVFVRAEGPLLPKGCPQAVQKPAPGLASAPQAGQYLAVCAVAVSRIPQRVQKREPSGRGTPQFEQFIPSPPVFRIHSLNWVLLPP
jgi:hypothetical protein